MAAARNIASDRVERPHELAGPQAGDGLMHPGSGALAPGEGADLTRGGAQRLAHGWIGGMPGRGRFFSRDPQERRIGEAVEALGIAEQELVAVVADASNDLLDRRENCSESGRPPAFESVNHRRLSSPGLYQLHHKTTLFSGYSTIPVALAAFSCGITSRATPSSTIVLTATHSESLSWEMVGELSAGSTARTAARSLRRTLSIKPTWDCASIAPRSMSAIWPIFSLFQGSASADLPAIRWVSLSITVSMIRR